MTDTYQILESNIYKSIEQSKRKTKLELIKKGKFYLDIYTFTLYDEYSLYSLTIDASKDDKHNYYIFYLLQLIQVNNDKKQIIKTGKIFLQNHIDQITTNNRFKHSDITNISSNVHINYNLLLKCTKNKDYSKLYFNEFTSNQLLDLYYENFTLNSSFKDKLFVLISVIYNLKFFKETPYFITNAIYIKNLKDLIVSSKELTLLNKIITNIESHIDETNNNTYIKGMFSLLNNSNLDNTLQSIYEVLTRTYTSTPLYKNALKFCEDIYKLLCIEIKKCIINDYVNKNKSYIDNMFITYDINTIICYNEYDISDKFININRFFDNVKQDILSKYDIFIDDIEEYNYIFYIQESHSYMSVLYCIKLTDELHNNTFKTFVDNIRSRNECRLIGDPRAGCNNVDFMFTLLYYVLDYINFNYPIYIFDASNFNKKGLPYDHCIDNEYRSVLLYSVLNKPTFYNKYGFENDYSSTEITLQEIINLNNYFLCIFESLISFIKNDTTNINKSITLNKITKPYIIQYISLLTVNYNNYPNKSTDIDFDEYTSNIKDFDTLLSNLNIYYEFFIYFKERFNMLLQKDEEPYKDILINDKEEFHSVILESINFLYKIYFEN